MNTQKTFNFVLGATLAVALSSASFAQDAKPAVAAATVAADADMTNAEVRKVDKDAKKITLKHEAIKNLDMPGMTMVFQVKDAALLEKTKAGDKVKFRVSKDGNAYVVTEIKVYE
jgi:Cu(I)/Ag(I) efflux system periplasmic protein CusF